MSVVDTFKAGGDSVSEELPNAAVGGGSVQR